jgi:hypothetical protein
MNKHFLGLFTLLAVGLPNSGQASLVHRVLEFQSDLIIKANQEEVLLSTYGERAQAASFKPREWQQKGQIECRLRSMADLAVPQRIVVGNRFLVVEQGEQVGPNGAYTFLKAVYLDPLRPLDVRDKVNLVQLSCSQEGLRVRDGGEGPTRSLERYQGPVGSVDLADALSATAVAVFFSPQESLQYIPLLGR